VQELRRHLMGPGALVRGLLRHWAEGFDGALEEVWEPFLEPDQP